MEQQLQMEQQYNRAKWWQLLFFVFNNTASNFYLCLMGFVNLYAGNVAGLAVMFVSNVMMAARFWDGITDPIIGFTFQNSATRGGQTVLTNDPKQRPMFARIDSIINTVLITGITVFITKFLVAKHGGWTAALFKEVIFTLAPISLILIILAIIGIWQKDQPETYMKLGEQAQYGFKDIFRIIKGNRAIQMLVIASSTDKLAGQVRQNSVVGIMMYGIVMGNYALLSDMSMITLIPSMLMVVVGTSIASRFSSKQATIIFTWGSIITTALLGIIMILGDPAQISLKHIGFMTIAYIGLYSLMYGMSSTSMGLAMPMIADCADYELYQSGNYAPALMGTVFGFFDKVVSSFSATMVGWFCVMIGFAERFPTQEDPLTPSIFWITMVLFFGLPILGWVASLIAMKFYPLDKEKMVEVQAKIADIKREVIKI